MKRSFHSRLLLMVMICIFTGAGSGLAADKLITDYQRDNLTLNGKWQVVVGHDDEELWKPQAREKITDWAEVTVPGTLTPRLPKGASEEARKAARQVDTKRKCVWVRREFDLSEAQSQRNVALKWNGIRFGATAWLNGRKITTHPTMGPHTALVPPDILKQGRNEILLKVPGYGSIPKSKTGFPLIPTGGAPTSWGSRNVAIYDDIYLEFYDRAYLKWTLAISDPKANKVTLRVWVDSAQKLPETLEISIAVRDLTEPGKLAGQSQSSFSAFDRPLDIPVSIQAPKLWTPQSPHLYLAELEARANGELCDKVSFSFGMRDIRVEGGHYRLNGAPLWLRGSNLVNEWRWGDRFRGQAKTYIVDEARVMNLNSFRTHTGPPPTSWVNVADEHGTMILAEFPVLYNYMKNFVLTPEDFEVWHKNILIDFPGWITKLWNHPSIVMWVISNETLDGLWEGGPYRDAVLALDPTRPTMRTGGLGSTPGTKDNLDLHPCANIAKGPEGWIIKDIIETAASKDPTRTLTCTEYMNIFGGRDRMTMLWTGKSEDPDIKRIWAEAAAEHTEAMRRVQLDVILPYMYAGWTRLRGNNWRQEFPTPMAAALHSSMSPVLASLDLFDRNYLSGQNISTPLYLINELPSDQPVKIDAYITPANPLLVPDAAALAEAVWHESFERVFKGDTIAVEQLRWSVPNKLGAYYLVVVLTRQGARPVVSQRMIRSLARADAAGALKHKRFILLAPDEAIVKWMKSNNLPYSTTLGKGRIDADTIVICDVAKVSRDDLAAAPAIIEFVLSGGKLVILNQPKWTWKELVDFEINRWRNWLNGVSSRVFRYEGIETSILSGVDPEHLKRWNGLPGTISDGWIKGEILDKGKRLLWQEKPERTVTFSMPMGKGEILICLLHLTERLNAGSKCYDPVAERVFVNLLNTTGRQDKYVK